MEDLAGSPGPGGCAFCGIYFTEQWVKMADSVLVIYLLYKTVCEISNYSVYEKVGCTKPFALFIIAHCLDIILFRLFHYLAGYQRYRQLVGELIENEERVLHARASAKMMNRFKCAACVAFVPLTFLGTLWFAQDAGCPKYVSSRLEEWLMMSWSVCFLYVVMKLRGQQRRHTGGALEPALEIPSTGNEEVLSGLASAAISSIKKHQLKRYEELQPNATSLASEPSEESQTVCTVCLEHIKINEWYKRLCNCGHYFHAECIDRWLHIRASCPVCREVVGNDDVARNQSRVTREQEPVTVSLIV